MNLNRKMLPILFGLALVGVVLATYDFMARALGVPLWCPFAGTGCDTVQASPYAVILGIPLAFLGILGFGAYLVLGYISLLSGPGAQWAPFVLLGVNLVEVSSMGYFAYVQVAWIHAVCSLCMFSAALNVALGVTIVYGIATGRPRLGTARA